MVVVTQRLHDNRALIAPYYTLHILSATLLSGLLLVFALRPKKTHPTLISLIVALILDSALHCVILGHEESPSTGVAVCSTVFAASGIIATTGSFSAIIVKIWSTVVLKLSMTVRWEKIMDIMLVAIPWTFCLAMVVGSSIATALHPENIAVTELGAYNMDGRVTYTSRVIAAVFLLIVAVFEFWTITAYLRRPSRLRVGRHQSEVSPDPRLITKSVLDVGFTVRTLAFGIYASVAIVFAIVSLVSTSAAPAFYQATAGIVAFVLFGAQRDILQFVRILPSHPHQNLQESPTEHVNVFDKQTQAILDGSEEKDGSADEGDVEKGIEPSTDRKDEEKSAAEEVKVGEATLSSHHP